MVVAGSPSSIRGIRKRSAGLSHVVAGCRELAGLENGALK